MNSHEKRFAKRFETHTATLAETHGQHCIHRNAQRIMFYATVNWKIMNVQKWVRNILIFNSDRDRHPTYFVHRLQNGTMNSNATLGHSQQKENKPINYRQILLFKQINYRPRLTITVFGATRTPARDQRRLRRRQIWISLGIIKSVRARVPNCLVALD